MRTKYIFDGLMLHCLIIGAILLFILLLLRRRRLFHWLSAGFWAWAAFALYFFIVPLIQYLGDPHYLEIQLALTEGLPRMIWVSCCIAVGLGTFFWAYLRGRPGNPRWGLNREDWPMGTWIIIILALTGAAYSLTVFRGAFGFEAAHFELEESRRHVGAVTGYQTVLHMLALFPIILLSMRRTTRIIGIALAGVYLVGKMNDMYDRVTAVSLFIGISMALTFVRGRKWPSGWWIVGVLLLTLFLQARGHLSLIQFRESGKMTVETSREEVRRGEGAVMLSTFYLKSYVHDKAGYTYGIPLISSLVFGALPRKYFPWKDWMVDTYLSKVTRSFHLEPLLFGSKSSVIGDLYGFGGIFAIAGGMFILGFLVRKVDGWLAPPAPMAVRAMGIVWLSYLWMMLGSSLLWTATVLYLTIIPFVGVVLCGKIFGTFGRLPVAGVKYQWLK